MELSGTTALVTGASGGIGRAVTLALVRRGVHVKATALEDADLALLSRLRRVEVLAADLGDEEDLRGVLTWIGDEADLLVNNAGFGWHGALTDIEPSRVEDMMRVNLEAPIRLTAALTPAMVRRGRGHVVNVASIAGYVGVAREALYSSTKAGLIAFSESIRYELAGTGVGVSVVLPAAVDTGFFRRSGHPYDRRLPRLAGPERVADALVRAVERDIPEVFVPRWMALPARVRGGMPQVFRRLAGGAM